MPANSKEYQKAYRVKNHATRKVVSVSLSVDDHRDIARYAKKHRLSVSSLLREATLHQCRKSQLASPEVQNELRELRFLLSNIANNMNQIAHHSNRIRYVIDENAALAHLAELDALIRNFVSDRMHDQ